MAINWCGWGQVRETATKTCTFFTDVLGHFLRKVKVISAHLLSIVYIYPVLDKAGLAKVLDDMCEV